MKSEFLIPVIIISIHLIAAYLGWQNSWAITVPKWLLRITLTSLVICSSFWIMEEIQYDLRPQVILIFIISTALCLFIWLSASQIFIWSIFTLQFLILGLGSIWFVFFFRITKLF
ncbi:hypothetical protein WH96_15695 [Kiloniella spongiae]|uniref:Uncharacterized protein n=1 Tax=Kiloniella spongiae TaxID=1489064 RepID=A0A0H2MB87_9PROT|nr:hypothetical protein WH96_15695 [Kiloniella spongiae]